MKAESGKAEIILCPLFSSALISSFECRLPLRAPGDMLMHAG
jgi:hypothetical protein